MDLHSLLEHTLPGLGCEFVALEVLHGGALRVFIDKEGGVDIEDCARVSNHLTRLFAVENIDYERLEVSSPGLDRPLTKAADFERFAGSLAKIKMRVAMDGQKHFRGRLQGLENDAVALDVDGRGVVLLPLSNLDKARLDPEF